MLAFKFLYPIFTVIIAVVTLGKVTKKYFYERTSFTLFSFVALALNTLSILVYSLICASINIFKVNELSFLLIIISILLLPALIRLYLKLKIEYSKNLKTFFNNKNFSVIKTELALLALILVLFLLLYFNPSSLKEIYPIHFSLGKKEIVIGWIIKNKFLFFLNSINLFILNLISTNIFFIHKKIVPNVTLKTLKYIPVINIILSTVAIVFDVFLPLRKVYFLPQVMNLVFSVLIMTSLKIVQSIPHTNILPQVFSLNIFDVIEDAIAFIDLNFKVIYTNSAFDKLFKKDTLNKNIKTILPYDFNMKNLKENHVDTIEINTSEKKYLRIKYFIQEDNFSDLLGAVLILQDFTQLFTEAKSISYDAKNVNKIFLKQNQELIKQNQILKTQLERRNFLQNESLRLMKLDSLTQVYNRVYFFEILNQTIDSLQKKFSVFSIDINEFKYLNDLKGHWLGDLILIEVVQTIKQFLGNDGILARSDGDNFLLLHKDIYTKEDALIFSRIISNLVSDINSIRDLDVYISISIGVCIYKDGMSAEDLVNNAELANLQASFETDKKYIVFTPEISKSISERFILISEIKKSYEQNNFIPYYQPQVLVSKDNSSKVIGYEALARWQHPEKGLLTPYHFIEVAESSGTIIGISYSILEQTCYAINNLESLGFKNFKISVNISAKQLNSETFLKTIRDIFFRTKVNTSLLEFEITETEILVYNKRILSKCIELKKLGISISVDDFGVAFASFNYIKTLPIDKMKIDKSFIDEIGKNKKIEEILYIVLEFAKVCNLDVVVEGVEHKYQLDFLLNENANIIVQGYYFYKPIPFEYILQNNIFPYEKVKNLEVN